MMRQRTGWVVFAGIAIMAGVAAAATWTTGADETISSSKPPVLGFPSKKLLCSQTSPGARLNLPGATNPDGGVPLNNCSEVTTVAPDYCSTIGTPGIACKQPDAGVIDPDDLPPTTAYGDGSNDYYALWSGAHGLTYHNASWSEAAGMRLDLNTRGGFHFGTLVFGREPGFGVSNTIINQATEVGSYTASTLVGGPYNGQFPILQLEKMPPLSRGYGRIVNQGGPIALGYYAYSGSSYTEHLTVVPNVGVGIANTEPRPGLALDVGGKIAAANTLVAGSNVVLTGAKSTATQTATDSYTGRFTSSITATATVTSSHGSSGTWTNTVSGSASWTGAAIWTADYTGTSSATGTATGTSTVTGSGTGVATSTATLTGSGVFTATVTRTLTRTVDTTGTATSGESVYLLAASPVTVSVTGVDTDTATNKLRGSVDQNVLPKATTTDGVTMGNSGVKEIAGKVGVALTAGWAPRSELEVNGRISSGAGDIGHGDVGTSVRFLAVENIDAHGHYGFLDNSVISYATSGYFGHASFAAFPDVTGSTNSNHQHSFQDRQFFTGSGTLDYMRALYSRPIVTGSGTVTNLQHFFAGTPDGTGPITNMYGFYAEGSNTRAATNYAFYSDGAAPSRLGGPLTVYATGSTSNQLTLRDLANPRYEHRYNIDGAAGVVDMAYDTTGAVYLPIRLRASTLILNDVAGTGKVGIGTGSPLANLDVFSSSPTNLYVRSNSYASQTTWAEYDDGTSQIAWFGLGYRAYSSSAPRRSWYIGTGSAETLLIGTRANAWGAPGDNDLVTITTAGQLRAPNFRTPTGASAANQVLRATDTSGTSEWHTMTPSDVGALAADGATGSGNTVTVDSGKVTNVSTTSYLTPNAVSCSGKTKFNATNGQITSCTDATAADVGAVASTSISTIYSRNASGLTTDNDGATWEDLATWTSTMLSGATVSVEGVATVISDEPTETYCYLRVIYDSTVMAPQDPDNPVLISVGSLMKQISTLGVYSGTTGASHTVKLQINAQNGHTCTVTASRALLKGIMIGGT